MVTPRYIQEHFSEDRWGSRYGMRSTSQCMHRLSREQGRPAPALMPAGKNGVGSTSHAGMHRATCNGMHTSETGRVRSV